MAAYAARSIQKVFVGNIPWSIGHTELHDFFARFGPVVGASVVFDKTSGCSRGYGFVLFANNTRDSILKKLDDPSRLCLDGNYLALQPLDE